MRVKVNLCGGVVVTWFRGSLEEFWGEYLSRELTERPSIRPPIMA